MEVALSPVQTTQMMAQKVNLPDPYFLCITLNIEESLDVSDSSGDDAESIVDEGLEIIVDEICGSLDNLTREEIEDEIPRNLFPFSAHIC